ATWDFPSHDDPATVSLADVTSAWIDRNCPAFDDRTDASERIAAGSPAPGSAVFTAIQNTRANAASASTNEAAACAGDAPTACRVSATAPERTLCCTVPSRSAEATSDEPSTSAGGAVSPPLNRIDEAAIVSRADSSLSRCESTRKSDTKPPNHPQPSSDHARWARLPRYRDSFLKTNRL